MKAKRQEIIEQLRKLLADLEEETETKEKLCVSFEPTIYPTPLASPEMHCEVRLKVEDRTYSLVDVHITKKDRKYVSVLVKAYDPFIHSLPSFVSWEHRKFDVPLEEIKFTADLDTDSPSGEQNFFSARFHATFPSDEKKAWLCDVEIYQPCGYDENIINVNIDTPCADLVSSSIDLGDIK